MARTPDFSRSMTALRAVMAVALLVALATQLIYGLNRNGLSVVNFFSYFTVLSTVAAMIVLAVRAGKPEISLRRNFAEVNGAMTLYMAVTGLVYAVLLAPASADVGLTLGWVDSILHVVGPLAVVIDWLMVPPSHALGQKVLAKWMIFPGLYLIYSLSRGPVVDWYPYPFLDPGAVGGYGGVAGYTVLVAGVVVLIGLGLQKWSVRGASARTAVA